MSETVNQDFDPSLTELIESGKLEQAREPLRAWLASYSRTERAAFVVCQAVPRLADGNYVDAPKALQVIEVVADAKLVFAADTISLALAANFDPAKPSVRNLYEHRAFAWLWYPLGMARRKPTNSRIPVEESNPFPRGDRQ